MNKHRHQFHVAIVGGGLAGLSLAIALENRQIPFTIYEAKAAFTEIGAGIHLAPNGLEALRLIDASLGDEVFNITTRNPAPHENTWMVCKYGGPSGVHADGEMIVRIEAPPVGNMTMHRQELLRILANRVASEHTKFNKRFLSFQQDANSVKLYFADGTEDTASILVGADGIHSKVRTAMFGVGNAVSKPYFNQDGAYRTVVPMEKMKEAIGEDARQGQIMLGPNGYVICYPVNGGTSVNVGAWVPRPGTWENESEWLLPDQKNGLERHFQDWGERVHKILKLFDPSTGFWAGHQHIQQPGTFAKNRVVLIGDSAHSMPPHQGNGASQAVEDAYVLAEVLRNIDDSSCSLEDIKAAFQAAEQVRLPRCAKVQQYSTQAGPLFYSFFEQKLEGADLTQWIRGVKEKLHWIWHTDLAGDAERARKLAEQFILTARLE